MSTLHDSQGFRKEKQTKITAKRRNKIN